MKAEAAKLPGAGIGPKQSQKNAWQKKDSLTGSSENHKARSKGTPVGRNLDSRVVWGRTQKQNQRSAQALGFS